MKAVLLRGYGDVDQLSYEDVPDPKPGRGEVLVKMHGTSVNPADWKLRRGDFKGPTPLKFPVIPGYDLAGEVVALGPGVTDFIVGDQVMGLVSQSYAELVVCKADLLATIPPKLQAKQAAALPLVLLTGAQLIELGVQPKSGNLVLVTGAVGSVGRSAVHVALEHGARVIAGVRATQKSEAEELLTDRIVALDEKQEIAELGELDAIADTVGGEVIASLIPHIRKNGVLATVVGKPDAAKGRDLRVVTVFAKPDAKRLERLAHDVADGKFSIPIGKELRLADVREAQRLAERGGIGKVVMTP